MDRKEVEAEKDKIACWWILAVNIQEGKVQFYQCGCSTLFLSTKLSYLLSSLLYFSSLLFQYPYADELNAVEDVPHRGHTHPTLLFVYMVVQLTLHLISFSLSHVLFFLYLCYSILAAITYPILFVLSYSILFSLQLHILFSLFYLILFYSILSYSILFYSRCNYISYSLCSILFYSILSYSILFSLFYLIYLILFYPILLFSLVYCFFPLCSFSTPPLKTHSTHANLFLTKLTEWNCCSSLYIFHIQLSISSIR